MLSQDEGPILLGSFERPTAASKFDSSKAIDERSRAYVSVLVIGIHGVIGS